MKTISCLILAVLLSACAMTPSRCGAPLNTQAIRYDIEHPRSTVRDDHEWKDAMIVMESWIIECWQGGSK